MSTGARLHVRRLLAIARTTARASRLSGKETKIDTSGNEPDLGAKPCGQRACEVSKHLSFGGMPNQFAKLNFHSV